MSYPATCHKPVDGGSAEGAPPGLPTELIVGVISDTHNHLYPEVKALLAGVDHIIHAGDVCSHALIAELRDIAPLTVVRGNCDIGGWADALPVRAEIELSRVRILVGHIGGPLREEAAARAAATAEARSGEVDRRSAGMIDVVVFGHSHQALEERRNGVLYLNPGSAGPRRYGRPRTMAFLRIAPDGGTVDGALENCEGGGAARRASVGIVIV